jgi:hypothetical protein
MNDADDSDLDRQIAEYEAILGALKRKRRAKRAGRASGRARNRADRDALMVARYNELGRAYGAVRAIAGEFGLSEKQVHRVLGRSATRRGEPGNALRRPDKTSAASNGKLDRITPLPKLAAAPKMGRKRPMPAGQLSLSL